jgi:hypothetical protein
VALQGLGGSSMILNQAGHWNNNSHCSLAKRLCVEEDIQHSSREFPKLWKLLYNLAGDEMSATADGGSVTVCGRPTLKRNGLKKSGLA